MRIQSMSAIAATLLLAAAAVAQPTVRAGQTITAQLTASAPLLTDDSHFDQYIYQGAPGDRIVITLRSDDFDAFLYWGSVERGAFTQIAADDDGAGDTDARLAVTTGTGMHAIRINSYAAGETGSYTLTVERADPALPSDAAGVAGTAAVAPAITIGQVVSGRLSSSSRMMGDTSHFAEYIYQGQPGDRLVIHLRSTDFDAYLLWGKLNNSKFSRLGEDDDGAGEGQTDSRLAVTVGASGTHAIRAGTLEPRDTGAFTLSVERDTSALPSPTSGAHGTITAGQTVIGILDAGSPLLSDTTRYHDYLYEGTAGERLVITMRSLDFDAFVLMGSVVDGVVTQVGMDDDSGGGSDARLEVTLETTGTYIIRANAYAPGEMGSYTISVQRATTHPQAGQGLH